MSEQQIPSFASLLRNGCQVTHCKSTRGWIETPDGRYFKPEPAKVQFIKGRNRQGKITKARSPQGLTPDSFCPWLLFASYVLTLP
ncbi:hypothetical protein RX33_00277 [Escherichia coli]|uniref:phage filamentation protein Fil family protein n=1 Tax=Escherichia coli TaxID=562 RepID=UPI000B9441CE|nr:hypothetical protein RX33_00277 [Escherichia coli]